MQDAKRNREMVIVRDARPEGLTDAEWFGVLRRRAGISNRGLERLTRVDRQSIGAWENGEPGRLSARLADRLWAALESGGSGGGGSGGESHDLLDRRRRVAVAT